MNIAKLVRATAVAVIGLSMSGGVAAAQTGSIGTTGPKSWNTIKFKNSDSRKVSNNNDLAFSNSNAQKAKTGEAEVKHNTTGGGATSGSAMNDAALDVSADVDNSSSAGVLGDVGCGCDSSADIENTGPDSKNEVKFENTTKLEVKNVNHIMISNNNNQQATSGEAEVYGNTTGGDATSGDAVNTSSTTVSLSVAN